VASECTVIRPRQVEMKSVAIEMSGSENNVVHCCGIQGHIKCFKQLDKTRVERTAPVMFVPTRPTSELDILFGSIGVG
jgi:hypothetical protein